MKYTVEELSESVLRGDRRALARAISLVEDGGPESSALMHKLFFYSGKAHLIGITGSPGTGKSTLLDALISEIRLCRA